LLRHTLATLAYRGGKAVRNAPAGFSDFRGGEELRTSGQILAHIGNLFDWALSIATGRQKWQNSTLPTWEQEVTRFFTADSFPPSTSTFRSLLSPSCLASVVLFQFGTCD
jgi:hypothetical protein